MSQYVSPFRVFCERKGVRATSKFVETQSDGATKYKVRLTYRLRSLTTDFTQGSAFTSDPEPASVLACLLSDADSADYRSFEEWAGDLGYDADSREAERAYKACVALAPKLKRFLGDDYSAFRDASAEH